MARPEFSIVIPAYNESLRIGRTLDAVLTCISLRNWDAEVIVVDDGSTDDTAAIVSELIRSNHRIQLIRNRGNRGKGYSVRNGSLQATGRIVLFSDADLSAPIEEAERLFAAIDNGADVAIGSRWLDRQRQTVRQPFYRRFFSRCFNATTRSVVGLPYADTQCGFKAFRQEAAQIIFRLQRIERWGFDPEILVITRKLGFRIQEVAVAWGHDERTRISYLRDGMQMLRDIATIRWNQLAGRYDAELAAVRDLDTITTPPAVL